MSFLLQSIIFRIAFASNTTRFERVDRKTRFNFNMYRLWSLLLMFWGTTALAGGNVAKRFIMDGYPGGDPSHQLSGQYNSSGSPGSPGFQMPVLVYPGGNPMSGQSGGPGFHMPTGVYPGGDPSHQLSSQYSQSGSPGGHLPIMGISTPTHPTDTTAQTTPIPSTTTTTSSTVASTAPDFCGVAKQLCTANCPGGYLVDPADCTFCICKKDALPG